MKEVVSKIQVLLNILLTESGCVESIKLYFKFQYIPQLLLTTLFFFYLFQSNCCSCWNCEKHHFLCSTRFFWERATRHGKCKCFHVLGLSCIFIVKSVCSRDKKKHISIWKCNQKMHQSWNNHFHAAKGSQIPSFRNWDWCCLKGCGPLLFVFWSFVSGKISLSLGAIFAWDSVFSSG